jgi:hypothetical protein
MDDINIVRDFAKLKIAGGEAGCVLPEGGDAE